MTPLQVDVLIHQREAFRPSSTGNLIPRVVSGSRQHLWLRDKRVERQDVVSDGREIWILHPKGEPVPVGCAPAGVQVVLLDGSWREAAAMAQHVCGWGRTVRLPLAGESRFWLRAQADTQRFSTAEALLCLFDLFGLAGARDAFRLQFELHVYANLRARGLKDLALEFLSGSPIRGEFADLIAQLDVPRPR